MSLSAGTVITKETKVPNNRVLPGALLFGCIVSFVVVICDSLATYRRNQIKSFEIPKAIVQKKKKCRVTKLIFKLSGREAELKV